MAPSDKWPSPFQRRGEITMLLRRKSSILNARFPLSASILLDVRLFGAGALVWLYCTIRRRATSIPRHSPTGHSPIQIKGRSHAATFCLMITSSRRDQKTTEQADNRDDRNKSDHSIRSRPVPGKYERSDSGGRSVCAYARLHLPSRRSEWRYLTRHCRARTTRQLLANKALP